MEHPGFFDRQGPFALSKLVEITGAELPEGADGSVEVVDARPLDDAAPGHISFLDNPKYAMQLAQTRASACFLKPKFVPRLPESVTALITDKPYHAFAKALSLFYPQAQHPMVVPSPVGSSGVHPDARLEPGVTIQPGAIVAAEAQIGSGSVIAAGAVVGYRVTIGRNCFVGPNATITHALIGNNVIIHAGVRIGQDGFGFALGPEGHLKVPQIGRVIIQDHVEIGANTTIDRGALKDTVVGEGTKIDNLVQIAHNVVIGRNCVIVAQVGISGSTILDDFVVMGGQSGVVGHVRLGAGAQVAGNSGVAQSIPPGERWGGTPARPARQWAREMALLKRLNETLSGKDLRRLKRQAD